MAEPDILMIAGSGRFVRSALINKFAGYASPVGYADI